MYKPSFSEMLHGPWFLDGGMPNGIKFGSTAGGFVAASLVGFLAIPPLSPENRPIITPENPTTTTSKGIVELVGATCRRVGKGLELSVNKAILTDGERKKDIYAKPFNVDILAFPGIDFPGRLDRIDWIIKNITGKAENTTVSLSEQCTLTTKAVLGFIRNEVEGHSKK